VPSFAIKRIYDDDDDAIISMQRTWQQISWAAGSDCNAGIEFSIPGSGIEKFVTTVWWLVGDILVAGRRCRGL